MSRQREVQDHYFRLARKAGYVARSAYKLIEIQEKHGLIRPGDRVLDLGYYPGAWLQVACQAIGPMKHGGCVVGVDLQPKPSARPRFCDDRVLAIEADVFALTAPDLLGTADHEADGGQPSPPLFDVVLSDMMEATTGHKPTDHLRSVALARRVLDLLPEVLAPGGNLAVKVFDGEQYRSFLDECKAVCASVKSFKPKASRAVSSEMYVVGKGYAPRRGR
ncbi:MAG: RlmE family RNA methyltransferase [Planctomycetes bacterium]|nr:RlmE family RNA methyltransferase [Planctomycetota bacterium]NOG52875.1 RlmE family RNA methyltransferase [Planctomycetota bacterium]